MLFHLFEWFKQQEIKFPGSALFNFITFRVLLAMILAVQIFSCMGILQHHHSSFIICIA